LVVRSAAASGALLRWLVCLCSIDQRVVVLAVCELACGM